MKQKKPMGFTSPAGFGLQSWLMVGGLMVLVFLLLYLAKLKSPQDIRQKAAGSQCYLLIKDKLGGDVSVVEGAGGKQQIGGVNFCVGGVGNDADRYPSYFTSKVLGQTALSQKQHACQNDKLEGYVIGDSCRVDGQEGKVICVGGDKEEYFGCITQVNGKKLYQRLASRKIKASVSPTPSVISDQMQSQDSYNHLPSPTDSIKNSSWTNKLITIKVGFVPEPALDLTKPEKNQWPWIAVFLNNGANYQGTFDQASCSQPEKQLSLVKYKSITKLSQCGQPNLYQDKLIDNLETKPKHPNQMVVEKSWSVKAGDLFVSAKPDSFSPVVKLSLVFYNGYWDGESKARRLGIKFIEFLNEDGQVLVRYSPGDKSFWLGDKKRNWTQKQSFYLDLGRVNDLGKKDQYQDGFVYAFDKEELKPAVVDKTNDVWWLDDEGSFNLVSSGLWKKMVSS